MPTKDQSKPDGEAVNADGTLKPADEIEWLHSPSDEPRGLRPSILGPNEEISTAPGKMQEQKKSQVSRYESKGHDGNNSPFSVIHFW